MLKSKNTPKTPYFFKNFFLSKKFLWDNFPRFLLKNNARIARIRKKNSVAAIGLKKEMRNKLGHYHTVLFVQLRSQIFRQAKQKTE